MEQRQISHQCPICNRTVFVDEDPQSCSCEWSEYEIEQYEEMMKTHQEMIQLQCRFPGSCEMTGIHNSTDCHTSQMYESIISELKVEREYVTRGAHA